MFVDILKTIFLGIVEGITEWLPVSSTGHLILADEFIQLGVTDAFKEMFDVVIQLGAILAVVVMFWHKLWPFQNDRSAQGLARWCREDVWQMWFHVLVAVLPSVVIGLPLDDWLTQHFHKPPVIALMLILYGVLFIWMENTIGKQRPRVRRIDQINYRIALFIGAFQVLSLIPGTSRSGATILGAMIIGCSRTIAAEFTFFLAVPTMFGASLLKIVKFLLESETGFSGQEIVILLVGMVTAFVVSLACIRFLMNFVKKHDYKVFGWYRIVLGVLVLGYFFGLKPLLEG